MVDLEAYNHSLAELVNKHSVSDAVHVVVSESELTELPLSAYSCEVCGLKVKTKANLRAHKIKTHKIMRNIKDFAFYSKQKYPLTHVYHCPFTPCKHNIGQDGGFSTFSRLKQHYQHVHMRKKYECVKCRQSFSTPAHHAYHERQCGTTYICSTCHRVYSNKKHLLQHYRRTGHKTCNSSDETKSHKSVSPSECSVPITGDNCTPIVLPVFVLPVTVSLETPYTETPFVNSSNYTNIISALQTISGQVLSEQLSKYSCPSTVQYNDATYTQPAPTNYRISNHLPNIVEASTQTDAQYIPRLLIHSNSPVPQPQYVSVNTCTDEDNISSFLGGLFCDANVGTNCSPLISNIDHQSNNALNQLNNDRCCSPLKLDRFSNSNDISLNENGNANSINSTSAKSVGVRIVKPLNSDVCLSSNSNTKSLHLTHTNHSQRMLETPPPPYVPPSMNNNVSLGTHLNTACQTFPESSATSRSTCTHVTTSTNVAIFNDDYNVVTDLSKPSTMTNLPYSSTETQAQNWSSIVFSTNETQTIDHDIELWLNSVETQTNTVPFDPALFSDICVGVGVDDDDLFV